MLKKLITSFTVLIMILSTAATISLAATGTVNGSPNFRSAPSTNSNIYGNLNNGQRIEVLSRVNQHWLRVQANGRTGYVSSNFVTIGNSSNSRNTTATTSSSSRADAILSTGNRFLGTPYQFGATYARDRKFDCSSFVQYVFRQHGISLPRTSIQQSKQGTFVSKSNLRKGDLVFFRVNGSSNIGHVGIYAGNGRILHTYGQGGVRYDSITSGHWSRNYVTARRVIR